MSSEFHRAWQILGAFLSNSGLRWFASTSGTSGGGSHWLAGRIPATAPHNFRKSDAIPRSGAVLGLCRKSKMTKPTEEQIRKRAQEIWEENHRPDGRDDEFWHEAEKELNEKELGDIAKEPPPTILPG
jgi:hypothetical protein